ncbi:restriction endonuclease subunit S [Natrinema zhouii]|uniref:Restriction endonuclease subunit S n=1 Tax=Natrinema zhouii TaxID=1710539 RepID=A0A7D6CRX6_9EURY|nr:restriction endonuclease subunit S [Natrinema zhouii]QLK27189.1 restriction endonuclease subunit S [Natrinema zhouii]
MSETAGQSDLRESYKEVKIGPKSFDIPEEWSVETIPDLCNLDTESFDASNHSEETFEYIDIESVSRGTINQSKTIPVEDTPSRAKQIISTGDILVGKVRPYLQAFAPVTEEHDGKVCSTGFAVLSAKEDVYSSYITQAILSKYFLDQMTNRMTGTSYPAVNKSDFENVRLFVPPLIEQKIIADILSTVDEQLQQIDEIIQITTTLKSAVANRLFVNGIKNNGQKSVKLGPKSVTLPNNWDVTKLTNLESPEENAVQTGPYQLGDVEFKDSGLRVYGQSNVTSDNYESVSNHISLDLEDDFSRYKIRSRDVLLTRMGTVGDASLFPDDAQPGILSYHLLRIRPDQNSCWSPYLHHLLNDGKIVMDQIKSLSHGSIMDGLNVSTLRQVRVPLPPLDEQQKIGQILDQFDKKIEEYSQSKQRLQELKNGLMQDLLTGKVRVNTDN